MNARPIRPSSRSPLRRWLTMAAVVVVAVPVVEILVAVAVSRWIGVDVTLGLILLGCLGGVWVLRWAGGSALRELGRLRRPGVITPDEAGRPMDRTAGDTGLKVLAGLLLLFPGLLTDLAGLLLLVPQIRGPVGRWLAHRMRRRFEVAARRVTVHGETVEGVTVTSWVEDDLAAQPPRLTAAPERSSNDPTSSQQQPGRPGQR